MGGDCNDSDNDIDIAEMEQELIGLDDSADDTSDDDDDDTPTKRKGNKGRKGGKGKGKKRGRKETITEPIS